MGDSPGLAVKEDIRLVTVYLAHPFTTSLQTIPSF